MSVLTSARCSVLGTLTVALSLLASAQPEMPRTESQIDIKGIYIGMPRADVKKKFPKMFTEVAGVRLKNAPHIEYRDDKVDTFYVLFDSDNFKTMKEALTEKYPELFCLDFEDMCYLEDASGVLMLGRHMGGFGTSAIVLDSHKRKEENREKAKQQRKDI